MYALFRGRKRRVSLSRCRRLPKTSIPEMQFSTRTASTLSGRENVFQQPDLLRAVRQDVQLLSLPAGNVLRRLRQLLPRRIPLHNNLAEVRQESHWRNDAYVFSRQSKRYSEDSGPAEFHDW